MSGFPSPNPRRRSSIMPSSTNLNAADNNNNNNNDSIKVICRFRPILQNRRESSRPDQQVSSVNFRLDEERNEVFFSNEMSDCKTFKFDKVSQQNK